MSVWAGGLAAAAGATGWWLSHGPATRATLDLFLALVALLFIADVFPDQEGGHVWQSRWPLVGLTPTVMVFSRDPLVVMLAVLAAAPLAGLVQCESVQRQVTRLAWWLIASGSGLLIFGLVVNALHGGLIVGSMVLIVFFVLSDYCVTWIFRAHDPAPALGLLRRLDAVFAPLFFACLGALYGLSRLTSQFGFFARHGGLIAVLISIGLVLGCFLGGTIASVWRRADGVTSRTGFLIAVLGLGIFLLPGRLALALGTATALIFLVVSLRKRTPGGALACFGALVNLVVVQLNGGRMPVEAGAFFGLVGPEGYAQYAARTNLESVKTALSALDDRILLPHPFPFAAVWSAGDIMLAVGLVVFTVELMITRPRVITEHAAGHRRTAA